jgi:protein-L-isoaspartate O-methyltransferase
LAQELPLYKTRFVPKDLSRRTTFDRVADIYQKGRPDYPEELFDVLFELIAEPAPVRLLELGCGSGKATAALARRCPEVVALELGVQLAEQARRNLADFPGVEVVVGEFESWTPAKPEFDVVVAANTWSWLDPSAKYAKAAKLLRPGGHLAVWDTSQGFSDDVDPFFEELQRAYAGAHEYKGTWPPPPASDLADEFAASGFFEVVDTRRFEWTVSYDAEAYCNLLNTFAGHLALADKDRERVFAEVHRLLAARPDGQITREWIALMTVGRAPA